MLDVAINDFNKGTSPPQIGSDPNAFADPRNPIEYLDDSNVRPLKKESSASFKLS